MLFVPFHEGWLDYDCLECGAECCQSGNIVATAKEAHTLLREYPSLAFFATGDGMSAPSFRKHLPCWFLGSDGLCTIERRHGRALKPYICRLHPFYVTRCGNDYVVTPSGCQRLCVTQPGQQSHISHEVILANAQESIDGGRVRGEIDWSPARMDLERSLLDESRTLSDSVCYMDYAVRQVIAANPERSPADVQTQLNNALRLWKEFLGVADLSIENPGITRELTAITSLLRVTHYSLQNMSPDRIPLVLLALYMYMILFSQGVSVRRFLGTYESVLNDVPLGLVHLTDADLRFTNRSLERRLHCVRALRDLHAVGFRKRWGSEKKGSELR